jgi:hypothetical protein
MSKLLIVALALIGAYLLMSLFFHAAMVAGFHVGHTFIPWWIVVLVVVAFLGYKLKSK